MLNEGNGGVGGVTGTKSKGTVWRNASAAVFLLFGLGSGLASAAPDDDYAVGMESYRRSDFATALQPLRKAADAGHVEAQVVLASILDAAESNEEAVGYYRKAAAAGNLDGMFGLASLLASGEGVKKDLSEAKMFYGRAAEGGHKQAVKVLAEAYIRGQMDITEGERKGREALKWITLAADDDFMVALEALEAAYRTGDYGITADLTKADLLKQKIAKMKGVKERKNRRGGQK